MSGGKKADSSKQRSNKITTLEVGKKSATVAS